ncbi:hypothetical protein [Laspinema palackyanum]|nr:hypothetical protein [Laspinema sp. D2c]
MKEAIAATHKEAIAFSRPNQAPPQPKLHPGDRPPDPPHAPILPSLSL